MTRRLCVFAHFDPDGLVAPHVEHSLRSLAEVADRLVIVSTAPLTGAAEATLQRYGAVSRRANTGHDFASWRVGLATVRDLDSYDCWLLANDSCVGPLRPLPEIVATMSDRGADVWGITMTCETGTTHVQSYVLHLNGRAVADPRLRPLLTEAHDLADRRAVIRQLEIGLSRLATRAGLTIDAYFQPRRSEELLGVVRNVRHGVGSVKRMPGWLLNGLSGRPLQFNTSIALADRALADGRLPYVKISMLRDDPYRAGAARLLGRLESAFPAEFAGVRDYLVRTARFYPDSRRWLRRVSRAPSAGPPSDAT